LTIGSSTVGLSLREEAHEFAIGATLMAPAE
jgi:hypothetical protein